MWVIVKMMKHHTGVELPVILVDSYSEIMSFETEVEAIKMKEIFEANLVNYVSQYKRFNNNWDDSEKYNSSWMPRILQRKSSYFSSCWKHVERVDVTCSYGAACLRASPVLVLTLVGGGVFSNPEQGGQH